MSFTIVENVNDFVKARIHVTAGNGYTNTMRMAKLTPGTYTIDELITEFNTRVNSARWYSNESQYTTNNWSSTNGWSGGSGFLDLTYDSSAKTIKFVNNRGGTVHNFYFEHNPSSFTNCEFFRNVVELMPENYQKTPNITELCKNSMTFKSYDYNAPLIYKNVTSSSQSIYFNDTEFIVESMGYLTIEDLISKGISVTFENNVLTFKGIYNVSGIDYIGSWKQFQNQVKSEINIVYYFTNNNVVTIDNKSISLPVNFYNSYQLFNELPEFFTMYYWQIRESSDIVYLENPESTVNVTVDIDYNVLLDYTYSVSNLPLFNSSLVPIDYIVINENSFIYSRINYGDTNAIALIPKGIYTKELLAQTINNSIVYTWYSFDNVSLVESESTELNGLVNQIVFENNEITISNNSGHNNYFNYAWNIPDIPIFRNLVKDVYTPEINTGIIDNSIYTFHENSAILTIESMNLSQVMYNVSNKSSSTWDIVFKYSEMTEEQESFYGVYRISNNKVNCKQFYAFNDNIMVSMNINGIDVLFDIYEGFYSFQRLLENLSVSIQRIIHKTFNVVPPEVTIDLNENNVYKINIPGYTYHFNEITNDFFNACELIKDFNYSDSTFSYFNNTIDTNCFSITSNNVIINTTVPVYSFDYPIRQDYTSLNSGKYPSFAYYEWDITTLLPSGQGTKMYFKNATKMVGNNMGVFKNSIDCGLFPSAMLLLCFYCSGDIEQDTYCTARFSWFGPNGYGSAWTSTRYYSKVKPVFSMITPMTLPSSKIYEGIEITVNSSNNTDIIVNKILFSVQVFPKGLSNEYYRLKYNDSTQNISKIFNSADINYSKLVFPTAGNIEQTSFNMNESSENVEINYSENDYNSLTYFFSCLNPYNNDNYSCATFGDYLVNSNRSRYNNRCFTSIPVINCDNYDFSTNVIMYSSNIRVSVQKFVTNDYINPENFIDYTREFTYSDLQDNQSLCVNNPVYLYINLACSRQEISSNSNVLMTDYEYTGRGSVTNGSSITLVNNKFKFTDAGVYSFIVNMYLYPGSIGTNNYLQQQVSFYMGGVYILSLTVDQTQNTVNVAAGRVSNGGLFRLNNPGEYDLTVSSSNANDTNTAPLMAFAYCDFLITKCY